MGWIAIFLFLALLFATNPSEGQFTSYLEKRIKEQAMDDESLSGSLKRVLAGPAASIAGSVAERNDYYLFSTYKIRVPGEEQVYLGILDHFIRLN